jgi:hypothetical protein
MKNLVVRVLLLTIGPSAGCGLDETQLSRVEIAVAVEPAMIEEPGIYVGRSRTVPVSLRNIGQTDVRISSIDVTNESGPALITISSYARLLRYDTKEIFDVEIIADENSAGQFSADIGIKSNDFESILVPVLTEILHEPHCDDGNPCTFDAFDGTVCTHANLADHSTCDDGNACSVDDLCLGGQCRGEMRVCDDLIDCTIDACDSNAGCIYEPANNRCEDENECTDDVCLAGFGCQNENKELGSICELNGCESIGLCNHGDCEIYDVPNGIPCSDGDSCTIGDTCQEGECTSGDPGSIQATNPMQATEGTFAADLCLHAPCADDVDGFVVYMVEPHEVLAVESLADSTVVIWRSIFLNEQGMLCDPDFYPNPTPIIPNCIDEEETVCDPEEQPPFPETCSSAIFASTIPNHDPMAPSTVQISTVQGAATAIFHASQTASSLLSMTVAHVNHKQELFLVDTFSLADWAIQDQYTALAIQPLNNPIAQIAAVSHDDKLSFMARNRYRSFDFAQTDFMVPLHSAHLSENALTFRHERALLLMEEDENCFEEFGPALRPLEIDDWSLRVQTDGEQDLVTFLLRMNPAICGDIWGTSRDQQLYSSSFGADTGDLVSMALIDPLVMPEPLDLHLLTATTPLMGTSSLFAIGLPDASYFDCDTGDCGFLQAVYAMNLDAGGQLSYDQTVLEFLPPGLSFDITDIQLDGEERALARIGNLIHLFWLDDEGEPRQYGAPFLPANISWVPTQSLKTNDSILAGITEVIFAEVFCGDAPCEGVGPPSPVHSVSIQSFACQEEQASPLATCETDAACGTEELCDISVCMAPTECGPEGCTPACLGWCRSAAP